MDSKIFRVTATSGLNLRSQPNTDAGTDVLVKLETGQAVARLNDVDYDGWYYVFADTPGIGLYTGYVYAQYLEVISRFAPSNPAEPAPIVDDDPDDPPRDLDETSSSGPPVVAPPTKIKLVDGWDPRIPDERRHVTKKRSNRRGPSVEHVVLHITGNADFNAVRNTFMSQPASAHYLVTTAGEIHQFVPETHAAWHSGIQPHIKKLYNSGDWRKYKRYFGWAGHHYDDDGPVVYVDRDFRDLPSKNGAALVRQADGSDWSAYDYFDRKWGRGPLIYPVGYHPTDRVGINHKSIGIEILSIGSPNPGPPHYTDAMYAALTPLVDEICARHGLTKNKRTVCGHEDVNPVERWGWDPGQGFDWDRVIGSSPPAIG